jgi:hypothetical protein
MIGYFIACSNASASTPPAHYTDDLQADKDPVCLGSVVRFTATTKCTSDDSLDGASTITAGGLTAKASGADGSGKNWIEVTTAVPGELTCQASVDGSTKSVTITVINVKTVNVDATDPSNAAVQYSVIGGDVPSASFSAPGVGADEFDMPEGTSFCVFDQTKLSSAPAGDSESINYLDLNTDPCGLLRIQATCVDKKGWVNNGVTGRTAVAGGGGDPDSKPLLSGNSGFVQAWEVVTYDVPVVAGSSTVKLGKERVGILIQKSEACEGVSSFYATHQYTDGASSSLQQDMIMQLPSGSPGITSGDAEAKPAVAKCQDNAWVAPSSSRMGVVNVGSIIINMGGSSGAILCDWGLGLVPIAFTQNVTTD